ncbi:hypothetical protein L2E82_23094 [Cichorium intybus]|uniref:Uncharacterized protein n=1 Tax=Cichorium intybus TaxID=13427 RepID=A0ACB9DZS0_CICIN|nr:hypothetical protein L2E82_23094 [Cichorium intybus]
MLFDHHQCPLYLLPQKENFEMGVDASIMSEVWPFLLGIYELNSCEEERESLRTQGRKLVRSNTGESKSNGDSDTFTQGMDSAESEEVVSARESLSSEEINSDTRLIDPNISKHCLSYKFQIDASLVATYGCIGTAIMARNGSKFPPQEQETQPGKEHIMNPTPQFMNPSYKPAGKLQGKVALVTGGDSGIGRAVCYLFVKEGATVAFTFLKGQEDKDADDTLRILFENKTNDAKDPIAIGADLGYDQNCQKVVEQVVENYGRIDILVNNAAEQHKTNSSLDELTEDRVDRVFRTNIFSQFFLCRHALKNMKEGGCIINTTSVNAYSGNPTVLDYTSTKGAIVSFTRGLALQLVQKGIRVNGVAPGPVYTPIQPASMDAGYVSELGSEAPMGRAAQPYEIAPSFVFLASDDSSYYTGQVLHPNGEMIVNA